MCCMLAQADLNQLKNEDIEKAIFRRVCRVCVGGKLNDIVIIVQQAVDDLLSVSYHMSYLKYKTLRSLKSRL